MAYRMTQYLDRFILSRTNVNFDGFGVRRSTNELYDVQLDDQDDACVYPTFLNTAKKAKYLLNYKKWISDVLNIKHSTMLISNNKRSKRYLPKTRPWPVNARKQPLIHKPQAALDMPNITRVDIHMYRHVIDWGRKGQIATIFFGEVHLWSSRSGEIAQTNTEKTVCDCLKWNKTGSRIAVSRTKSRISVIDGATLKFHETVRCPCCTCNVTAFEWTKNDDIIAGCSTGSISVIGVTDIKYACRIVNGPIVDLQLSCNETYLMVSTKNHDLHIFQWPMELNGEAKSAFLFHNKRILKCAAWHPWKNSILVIGDIYNKISVWNIDAQKCVDDGIVEPFFKKASDCILDYLTFCPMSGELVVSFYYENSESDVDGGCNFLTVFSDLHTRVDEIRYHVGRVPYALWNKQGTKLATLSTDENLVIWDFFGKESKARIHATNKTTKFPGIFDSQSQFGSLLR